MHSIGVSCKAYFFAAMHLIAIGPGPATKLSALIVIKGCQQLLAAIHNKRPMLGHGLGDWLAFKNQQKGVLRAVVKLQCGTAVGLNALASAQVMVFNLQLLTAIKIDHAVNVRAV